MQPKLLPRLILASLVLPASALLYQLALRAYPDGSVFLGYLWYAWVPPFYDFAFALMVLAPFVAATRTRYLRILALVLVTACIYLAAVIVVVNSQWALDQWADSQHLRFVTLVPTALVATALLAAATAWLGPLRVTRRFWICVALAGLVSGLAFLGANAGIMDYWLSNATSYGAYWLWPVATCLAIYYGRDPGQRS